MNYLNKILLLFVSFFILEIQALETTTPLHNLYVKNTNNKTLKQLNPFTPIIEKAKQKIKKIKPIANILNKTQNKLNKIKALSTITKQTFTDVKNIKNLNSIVPFTHRVLSQLNPPKKKQNNITHNSPVQKMDLKLFKSLDESTLSVGGIRSFFKSEYNYAPILLKNKINDTFLKKFMYFNIHTNLFQFPYIIKWGIKLSSGLSRNYDLKSTYFIPLSLSVILNFQLFKHQFITPFLEVGYSTWNINFSEYSNVFPFWSAGSLISLSLFKKSLRYTLLDEYSIKDLGFIVQLKNSLNATTSSKNKLKYFLHSLHIGIYFKF